MTYSEEFKIYCSTIAGEAGGSSDEAIRTVARCIITRINFREWSSYSNAIEIIKNTGFDAYTDRRNSPNYQSVYRSMSSGQVNGLSKRIIDLVYPIYNGTIPDETGMLVLYYSPRAQRSLHLRNPSKYKNTPNWDFSRLEQIHISGTENDDFNWYRYKGDGSTIKIKLVDYANNPIANQEIVVSVADRFNKTFNKRYMTNSSGEIPDIHARKQSEIKFEVLKKLCNTKLVADGKPKRVVLRNYECSFQSNTEEHITSESEIGGNSPQEPISQKKSSLSEELSLEQNGNKEIQFNIQAIEDDTGKPIPNMSYYLEYKGSIKLHRTDMSGIDSNIRANIMGCLELVIEKNK